MNCDDLISICIASYNSANYLVDLFESIENQLYKNYEVIFVDDGSIDNTNLICNRYSDRLKLKYYFQQNKGLSKARQLGIEKSNGKYLCFIDSDDFLSNQYLSLMYKKIKINNSDVCVCGTNMIKEGVIENKWIVIDDLNCQEMINDLETKYLYLCKHYYMSDSWNKLYKKDFILKNEITFSLEKGLRGNDFLFNYKLIMYSPKIVCVEECLYNHVYRNNSIVTTYKNNLQDSFISIIDQLISEQKKKFNNNYLLTQLSLLYYQEMYFSLSSIFKLAKKNERRKLYEEFKIKHLLFLDAHQLCMDSKANNIDTFLYKIITNGNYFFNTFLFYITKFLHR